MKKIAAELQERFLFAIVLLIGTFLMLIAGQLALQMPRTWQIKDISMDSKLNPNEVYALYREDYDFRLAPIRTDIPNLLATVATATQNPNSVLPPPVVAFKPPLQIVTTTPFRLSSPTLAANAVTVPTASQTAGASVTALPTASETPTPTLTPSQTPLPTSTARRTATRTATLTKTPTATNTSAPTVTITSTVTSTSTATRTSTSTAAPTGTVTPIPPNTPTSVILPSATHTRTPTVMVTLTPTRTPTHTPVNTATATLTPVPSATTTATATATFTPTMTATNTATPTNTLIPTATPTVLLPSICTISGSNNYDIPVGGCTAIYDTTAQGAIFSLDGKAGSGNFSVSWYGLLESQTTGTCTVHNANLTPGKGLTDIAVGKPTVTAPISITINNTTSKIITIQITVSDWLAGCQ